ncbi:MAG: AcvB/VirJ family lysyl-phosphatidylglycerol hydrolase [Bacteroidota bacterium]|nr:AcvB/VirJ family lysyl-phosphatidylglycerol hydrolase [Bacteroidota bacterium]
MKRLIASGFFVIYFLFSLTGQTVTVDSVRVNPFGDVFVYHVPHDTPSKLIIMISGDGGWKFGVPEFAKEFARMNSMVVGVDILRYYRHLKQQPEDCYMLTPDFTDLATTIERKYNFPAYVPPAVMGYSSGATLVYGILAQARPGTYMGGISLGFCPDFELPQMFCQIHGLEEKELVKGKSYVFMPDSVLGNHWVVLHGRADKVCDFKMVSDFVSKIPAAHLIALNGVGHGFSKWSDFMPQWKTAYSELAAKYNEEQAVRENNKNGLNGIPYVVTREIPPADKNMIAIFYSGDGGWYSFEQTISDRLAANGVSVIGIDIKKYLWNRKTPDKTASDATALLDHFSKEWNKSQFMIIGYSLGAEIVPFILSRLPQELKSKVVSTVMLSPQESTDFEIHLTDMLGIGNKRNIYNVVNEITLEKKIKQILIFGDNEKTQVPELLKGPNDKIIRIPGDHHYRRNSTLIIEKMEEAKAF